MDRAILEDHLRKSRSHAELGIRHIQKQRELVAELERDGHDVTESKRLLTLFEELQEEHLANCERLQKELAALDTRTVAEPKL